MSTWLRGGVASIVVMGALAGTAPSLGAQESPLQASVDPNLVERGEPAVIRSVDGCPGVVELTVTDPAGAEKDFTEETDSAGHWTFAYPAESPFGVYTVDSTCTETDVGHSVPYETLEFTLEPDRPTVWGLRMEIVPASQDPANRTATFRSIDPCPGHRTGRDAIWAIWRTDKSPPARQDWQTIAVRPDGHWTASLTRPTELGSYTLSVACRHPDIRPDGIHTTEGRDETGVYVLPLAVTELLPPGPPPPPAPPHPGEPNLTG